MPVRQCKTKCPKGKELKREEITLSQNCTLLNRLVHVICSLFVVQSCKYNIKITISTLLSLEKLPQGL